MIVYSEETIVNLKVVNEGVNSVNVFLKNVNEFSNFPMLGVIIPQNNINQEVVCEYIGYCCQFGFDS